MTRRRSSRPPTITSVGVAVVVFLLAAVYYAVIGRPAPAPPAPTRAPEGATPAASSWYSLYFTDPAGARAADLRGGPDAALAEAVAAARFSVDVAAYQFDLWSLRDALLDAKRRGLTVRFVTDSDSILDPEVEALEGADIPVIGDRREAIMHHKFFILDRLDVWTGSMNFTVNGAYRNNNNLIRVRSTQVAEDYLREFEEMFVDDRFGGASLADTPYPRLTIDGTQVEVMFSPDDGVQQHLVRLLQDARESIEFLAFSFTADEIGQTILDRAATGVRVRGVFEKSQASGRGSEYPRLRDAGLSVRLDGNPNNMHHKVIVIDGAIVITGSYNFTASAEDRNDENVIIFYSPELASQYAAEVQRVYEAAVP